MKRRYDKEEREEMIDNQSGKGLEKWKEIEERVSPSTSYVQFK